LNQETPESYEYDDDTGNLVEKNNLALDYPTANESDPTHPHAVASAAIDNVIVNAYSYDQNGNQTTREIGNDTFDLKYDAENRLVEVKKNNAIISQFTYDGNGQRVKSVINGETIRFVGGYYERKGSTITKYYMAGAARVAMRKYTIPQNMTVEYMLGDHLGSTSITTDTNGEQVSEMRYKPWGETRYTSTDAPANTSPAYELVKYQFTGQYSYDVEFGLKFYNARWLDSTTGRFVQADTMIPHPYNSNAYDRFSYVYNNPLVYTDPTGHFVCKGSNPEWEEGQTCYDVIQAWLDFLYQYGGEEGKALVEKFMAADGLSPIFFEFSDLGGAWGKTDHFSKSISITSNAGLAQGFTGLGYEASMFGHELFHLLNQNPGNMGTAQSEKEAYDFQATLLKNAGIALDPNWRVTQISAFGTSPEDMKKIAKNLNVAAEPTLRNTGTTIAGLGIGVLSFFHTSTGCFTGYSGRTCYAPGPYDVRYSPPPPMPLCENCG